MSVQLPKSFQPIQEQKSNLPASFKAVESNEQPKEEGMFLDDADIEREVERHTARLTSRGLEQVVGAPGNLRDFGYWLKDLYQKETGKLSKKLQPPKDPFVDEKGEPTEKTKEFKPLFGLIGGMIDYFPTSSEVKKFSQEKTGNYTTAKDDKEKIGDEIFEKIIATSIPGNGPRSAFRNVGIPVLSTLAKEGIKAIGGTPKEQMATEAGVAFSLNLMSRGNAVKYKDQQYKQLDAITPNATVPTANALKEAQEVRGRLLQGLQAPSEQAVLTVVDKLIDRLRSGRISATEAVSINRSLNEIRGDPALLERGRTLLNEVSQVNKGIVKQFESTHPDFYNQWKKSNEVFGAIAQSNYTANFIQKHYSHPFLSKGMKELFAGAVGTTAAVAGAAPPIYAVYKGIQVFDRMARSPELLRYYTNVIKSSAQGNVLTMSNNLDKLDKALKKEEEDKLKLKKPNKPDHRQNLKQPPAKK